MANANSATVSEKHLTKLNIPEAVPPHPRLLASKVDWERIRKQIQSDPVSARIFASLENRAKQLLKDPPVERVMIGRRLLDTSRLALARIGTLAMVFHVTREKAYADRAAKEMLAAASFPDWNPCSGKMTCGFRPNAKWGMRNAQCFKIPHPESHIQNPPSPLLLLGFQHSNLSSPVSNFLCRPPVASVSPF